MKEKRHKLVKDLDEEVWRKFIAYCKIKNVKVSKELEEILRKHLERNLKKILK